MHKTINQFLEHSLQKRKEDNCLRNLNLSKYMIDFYSNDYLGLASNNAIKKQVITRIEEDDFLLNGSTGSRLISGNHTIVMQLEDEVAYYHSTAAALFFHSGYNANLALFSCIATRHDTIIVDEYIHRSVHDGIKLSNATKRKFKHNNLNHLELLLQKSQGNCFVGVESLYSMDGDFAPLLDLITLTQKYNATLIVDEAHAFGVFGLGLVAELQLQDQVFATVVTYGKALGAEGACILGDTILKQYLINFATPFIYTTAPSVFLAMKVREAYQFLDKSQEIRSNLQKNIRLFRSFDLNNFACENSPIQTVFFDEGIQIDQVAKFLQATDMGVYAVKSPTVPLNRERLRICIHAFNTKAQILNLVQIIKSFTNE